MKVLVSGGAGYIGSHTCVELIGAGHEVVIADDLSNSSEKVLRRIEQICGVMPKLYQIDVKDEAALDKVFSENKDISAVIHFAAFKAVGESVEKPLEYYENNLCSTLILVKKMREHGVNNLVFSSSATVYGDPASVPVTEDFPIPAFSSSPYGTTKIYNEHILRDICAADKNFNVALLRYFNPIGAHSSGLIGEDPDGIPNNLIPFVAQVAVGRHDHIKIFGNDYPTKDGTGVRDYIHVVDLALGHVAALKKLENNCGLYICNLGTGVGYSVLEVIAAFEKACGKKLPYKVYPRRAGDIAEVYANPAKAANDLGWTAKFGIDDMCRDSWNWQSKNPKGYE